MYLKSLYLKNFRIYGERFFEFSEKMNLIHGKNAQGKTTLLEAIYYLISGKSFRTEKIEELIKEGENYLYIEASFFKNNILQCLKVSFNGKERKIVYNSTKLQSTTNLLGILHGVLLTPDDVELIKGSPLLRRRFFDLQIAQIDPLYIHYLTRYRAAMKQRNALLRQTRLASIEVFEDEMARAGAYITLQRHILVKELNQITPDLHQNLVKGDEKLHYQYKPTFNSEIDLSILKNYYIELLKKNRLREFDLGVTLAGPHKDDLLIFLNNRQALQFASEGQQRSSITSLRLSEWLRLKKMSEGHPLMLVDDFGISLDESRKEKLLTYLSGLHQVFITMTEPFKISHSSSVIQLIEI